MNWLWRLILRLLGLLFKTPVKLNVSMIPIGEENMANAGVTHKILDDGKGVLFTLTPVNKLNNPVPLPPNTPAIQGVSSAPASLANIVQDPGDATLTPPRPPDTTGLVFLGTVPQPPVDATGITVTFSTTLPDGDAISGTSDPLDVVADDSPVGFSITETAV